MYPLYARRPRRIALRTNPYAIEPLERRVLLAAVNWTGLGGDNLWTNPANWSSNPMLPGPTDDVTISVPADPTITLASGTQTINSLVSDENLTITVGTLSVAGASTINGNLTLGHAGTLSGAGDITLTGSANSWTAGTMSGTGKTIVASGATLVASHSTAVLILQRPLENSGTIVRSGTEFGWRFENGILNNQVGGTINDQAGTRIVNGGGTNAVNNAGAYTKTNIGTEIGIPFNNSGTLDVQAGSLVLSSGGTNSDTITVQSGATLVFSDSYIYAGGSSLSGAGTVTFTINAHTFSAGTFSPTGPVNLINAAIVNFNAPQTFTNLTLSGNALLAGTGDVSVTGTFNWTGGEMSGSGQTTVALGATMNLLGNGAKVTRRPFVNNGTVEWTAGAFFIQGTVTNNGAFNATTSSEIIISPPTTGTSGTFNNNGTVTKSGSGTVRVWILSGNSMPFNNSGNVDLQGGVLALDGGGTHTGDFSVAATSTLELGNYGGGSHSFDSTSDITGQGNLGSHANITHAGSVSIAGTAWFRGGASVFNGPFTFGGTSLVVDGAGIVTFNGTCGSPSTAEIFASFGAINFTGTMNFPALAELELDGASIHLGANSLSVANISMYTNNPAILGSGVLTVTDTFNWSRGEMFGPGQTVIAPGAIINMGTSSGLRRLLTNNGIANWTGGDIVFQPGGVLTNNGVFTATTSGTIGMIPFNGATGAFNNNGTFIKSGSGTVQFYLPFGSSLAFNNSGIVNVDGGTLILSGGTSSNSNLLEFDFGTTLILGSTFTHEATSSLAGTGTLTFSGGTHTFPAGTFNPAGTLNFNSGTITINDPIVTPTVNTTSATVTVNAPQTVPDFTLTGGTFGGSGDLTVTGSLNWSGGTMTGGAITEIAVGADLNVTGTGSRIANRDLQINGQATVNSGGGIVLRVNSLVVAPNAVLNLADNAVIVDYTAKDLADGDPLSDIKLLVTSGYNNGAWNGSGINSSVAGSTPGHAIGYAASSELFSSFPAIFAGQQVDQTAILLRYTRYGDANLDQTVNLSDFNRLAASFGSNNPTWAKGNFNFDQQTNLSDFNLLAANFGQSVGRGELLDLIGDDFETVIS